MILVTGGSGFIGANFILNWFSENEEPLVNLDKLTYASNQENLKHLKKSENYFFEKGSIEDFSLVSALLEKYRPRSIVNFAAESHVDRSINNPRDFLNSNTIGTFNLLESAREYWNMMPIKKKELFRFIHVSTDEVFGSLKKIGKFSESSQYKPSSPYSASKAASDHFVSSWFKTYKLPTVISNCSNNYGPRQFPEKLIPLTIMKIINNEKIPIYGNGSNIRDWLFVDDHIDALRTLSMKGEPGKKYCIGGGQELNNLKIINLICEKMDKKLKNKNKSNSLISFVQDRAGHDYRYSIDYTLISEELNWAPKTSLDEGLDRTLDWYLNNQKWCYEVVKSSKYNFERLGI